MEGLRRVILGNNLRLPVDMSLYVDTWDFESYKINYVWYSGVTTFDRMTRSISWIEQGVIRHRNYNFKY